MIEFLQAITPALITGIIAGVSGWVIARTNKSGSREIAIINELQEEVKSLRERVDSQDLKISTLNDQNIDQAVYIALLKQHIIQKLPPPPPEMK